MRKITLTQGYEACVSDEDYVSLTRFSWRVTFGQVTGQPYAARTTSVKTEGRKTTVLMHRQILDFPKGFVDHRNRNGLDNQRENLRACTQGQNLANTRKRDGCSSNYKGVSWDVGVRRWRAQIAFEGVKTFLGFFDTEEEAAGAYDEAAIRLYGEFARTNSRSSEVPF